jgi:hypothetical protein
MSMGHTVYVVGAVSGWRGSAAGPSLEYATGVGGRWILIISRL